MKQSTSFLGKCLTVLIGLCLSWATVTNPDVDSAAATLLGGTESAELQTAHFELQLIQDQQESFSAPIEPSGSETYTVGSNTASGFSLATTPDGDDALIQAMSAELKQLGASYLVLERLRHQDGVQYRVRCDLASHDAPVLCCFEATRQRAVEAMEEVLKVARSAAENRRSQQNSGVNSSI